ncbi:MAG TPA: class I SAM-dependent methyltransferase [Candidatus Paceibacterota bacterium]|jgi:SAM-dependent methyltransferase|nr:class I SAM-dependent methyltransferase [Candidatus Paceibacterota bacterium]
MDLFEKVKHSRTFGNLIRRFSLDTKAVLDVGSSEGHYLANFGPGSVGVTIIPAHVEEAAKRGLHVELKNVEDPAFDMGQKFDVAWANNFFEHMNAPHLFLAKMREQLKDDGTLILGVPVIPHVPFLTKLRKFRGAYAVSHVNYFTRKTLVETVRSAGWDVKEARLFYFANPFLDSFLNIVAPHIYVIAKPKKDFAYAPKRQLSLDGYH